ncbi:MAG: PhnD/SsuA/transferrin family substrate-binding protein, partial [Alphaproteobacteria bacterium]|nr:PhnD/SsuA/transferrin family substrate-binding protein [Alphaproteobacteria bacterium]
MSDRSGLSRLLGMVATAVVLVLSPPVRADGPDLGFHIGVAPHASARVILELYQPLREALQAGLGLPVEVVTAPDFTTYARRALAQDYDIAIVAGQQARMLETDGGYRPLVAYKAEFRTVAVVAAASAIQGPRDLAGAAIAGLGSASLADIWGLEWLRSAGIEVPEVTQVSAADSMARLILSGRTS